MPEVNVRYPFRADYRGPRCGWFMALSETHLVDYTEDVLILGWPVGANPDVLFLYRHEVPLAYIQAWRAEAAASLALRHHHAARMCALDRMDELWQACLRNPAGLYGPPTWTDFQHARDGYHHLLLGERVLAEDARTAARGYLIAEEHATPCLMSYRAAFIPDSHWVRTLTGMEWQTEREEESYA